MRQHASRLSKRLVFTATKAVALLAVLTAAVLSPFVYQSGTDSAMAIGAEDNDGMVLDQQAASGKTHFLNHPSPDAPDGYSLLTLNAMDTNGTSIRIGNVTVADISEKSSENSEPQNRNSDTVDNESSVLSNNNSNNNHPLTPKTFLLKDNHRYDITVPDHWIYNGTYYMFDHWLGIGKNDEVIDDDAKGNGSGSTTTLNTLAGSNNTTLTAVYQAVPIRESISQTRSIISSLQITL